VPLTYFEISAVLAFLAFCRGRRRCGGAGDGPGRSAGCHHGLTPFGLRYHQHRARPPDLLGQTIREIAHEKARIARPGVPLLLGTLAPEALAEVERVASETGSPLRRLGVDFCWAGLPVGVARAHQASNAALAVALADEVAASVGRVLQPEVIKRGLGETRWPGAT